MTRSNPNHADKAKSDAKIPVGACPLMKNIMSHCSFSYGLKE